MESEGKVTIEVEPSAVDVVNGWMVFQVAEIHGSVDKKGKDATGRYLHTKLRPESNKQIKVAYQMRAGAGPPPEGTVTMLEIEDASTGLLEFIENASDRAENNRKVEDW